MATFDSGAASTVAPVTAESVAYENGELVIAATATAPEFRISDDEILFIAGFQEHGSPLEKYRLCWLREQVAVTGNAAASSDSATQEQSSSPGTPSEQFAFFSAVLNESAIRELPKEVLERHILSGSGPVKQVESSASPSSPSLHVIVSTGSGLGQSQAFYDSVLRPLFSVFGLVEVTESGDSVPEGQIPYNLLVTKNSRSITEFAQTLDKSSAKIASTPTTIVLLSGDGGVIDLLNGMAEQDEAVDVTQLPAVALLPLGTGNALFHSLHRPDYLAAAAAAAAAASNQKENGKAMPKGPSSFVLGLRALFKGCATPLPNFEAHFSPGSHTVSYSLQEEEGGQSTLKERAEDVGRLRGAIVASYGFHAQLVWESDTPEYRKHGDKRFGMAAQELLKTSYAYNADVKFTKAGSAASATCQLSRRFNYVLASMVSNLEKTFTISPASEPLDGQLRLIYFGDVGGTKTMDIMMAAYNNGAHVGMRWTSAAGGGDSEEQAEESVGYDAIDELQVNVLEPDARWRKVCIDGTIVEIPQGGWMKVRKAPMPVLQIIV
ncbi:hypothetical protein SEPCBS57363_000230 [Sporothrix epigloea]|uniref:DAGKc domain-containing protein n=1 Tax=Sporothrix epigloea TaxID=1892477 RepID=A0ABP0D3K5_9PEZI